MNKLLLIDSRINYQPYVDSKKDNIDYILFNYYNDTFTSILDKVESNKYDQIGLVQHANFNSGFNILNQETIGLNNDTPPYTTFNSLLNFLVQLHIKGIQTFDFLGCELFDPVNTPIIFNYLEEESKIDLRASTNLTGSNGGDWIMESDNVDIKNTYFTDVIDKWSGTLNAYSNYSFFGTNKTIKNINGDIIFLNKDIYGNPLNPTIDSNGTQIKNLPGSVITWGGTSEGGDSSSVSDSLLSGVVAVYSTSSAFAALKSDDSVITWGNSSYGGDSSLVSDSLSSGVVAVYSSEYAFAALKSDGSVITWGESTTGGDSSSVSDYLSSGVVDVYFSRFAFAALKSDSSVITWGHSSSGGDSSSVSSLLSSGVVAIYSSLYAFAALKSDGSVITWGDSSEGGDSSSVSSLLSSGVVAIYSSSTAFAALKSDGSVITWGNSSEGGGDSSSVSSLLLSGVVVVYSTGSAFAALKSDGSVITWGYSYSGGDSSSVSASLLSGVVAVYSTSSAFAALKSDGSVITWGNISSGGDSSSVSDSLLSGVVAVYSTVTAFAALKSDGSVITWGDTSYGGDSSSVSSLLSSNVVAVYSTGYAFAALKTDGSIITWGNSLNGGDSSSVSASSGVVAVYSSMNAFAALKEITSTNEDNSTTDVFFVNNPFTISQNIDLYAQTNTTNNTTYDYILDINTQTTTMNGLFATRTFQQNTAEQNNAEEDNFTVDLTADINFINELLYATNAVAISSSMDSVSDKGAYDTLEVGEKLLGLRFLEIVATKIFGHAKARAAIANDTKFYEGYNVETSLIKQIADGINNSLVSKKNDIFNAYVAYDRIQDNNADDVNASHNFNFQNTNWEFPIYFESTLVGPSADATMDSLKNGPNVGGNQLVNGNMNVPILLRFSQAPIV